MKQQQKSLKEFQKKFLRLHNNFIENEVTEVARRISNDITILNLANFQSDLEELRNRIDECCNNNIDVIPDNEENSEDDIDEPLFNDDLV